MSFNTYDPGQVKASFAGIPLTGFASDTFIDAERTADAFSMKPGATGDIVRVRNRDRSGMVTFTLMAESPSNDLLSALARADELFGTGVGALHVEDLNGTTVIAASQAWIRKLPNPAMATDASERAWVIDCAALEILVGGSQS